MERVFNNPDFYPTPQAVICEMMDGEIIENKVFLEPSAGKGDIVEYLLINGANNVIACETSEDLRKILATKCGIIENDFFNLTSDKISHIDYVVMNPPFSNADRHILHAFDIAPAGCKIIALMNSNTLENAYSETRKRLKQTIEQNGHVLELGECFNDAERKTGVSVAMVKILKPGASYDTEFEGFFMDDDGPEKQENALMSYNVVRDLVNRYVEAVKIFDEQLETARRMHEMTNGFFSASIGLNISKGNQPITRSEFKKEMQKSGWKFIFEKMNMQKHTTQGLREDINKFVEQQQNIPFTMKNIYRMLEIVIGTTSQRMDKALVEVFDYVTSRSDENKFGLEGWKTNSHYLLNKKFIIPNLCYQDQRWYRGESKIQMSFNDRIEDFLKALCYITGDNYDMFVPLLDYCCYDFKIMTQDGRCIDTSHYYEEAERRAKALTAKGTTAMVQKIQILYGAPFEWAYFKCRAYKKGTLHFEFKSDDLWAKFNQHIARIKGYPLPETVKKPKAEKQTTPKTKPIILETIEI